MIHVKVINVPTKHRVRGCANMRCVFMNTHQKSMIQAAEKFGMFSKGQKLTSVSLSNRELVAHHNISTPLRSSSKSPKATFV